MTTKLISKLFKSQQKFINNKFGADTPANYGWVADNNSYLTKVYGQKDKFPTTIVTTFLDEDGKINHVSCAHN